MVEPEAVALKAPAEAYTETGVLPSAASADSSALEQSGNCHPEASNIQVEAATLH